MYKSHLLNLSHKAVDKLGTLRRTWDITNGQGPNSLNWLVRLREERRSMFIEMRSL